MKNKLKSFKVAKWRKDEWRMMKDEWWRLMIPSCWGVLLTDGQTDERMDKRTYICDCRVALATEKPHTFQVWSKLQLDTKDSNKKNFVSDVAAHQCHSLCNTFPLSIELNSPLSDYKLLPLLPPHSCKIGDISV